jgi:recombination protein RecA
MKLAEYSGFGSFLTGYPSLDIYLKGFPRGHFLQFSGRESSYKTTLIQNCFGYIQSELKDSLRYLYVDTEGNISRDYFEACGGDPDLTDFFLENKEEEVLEYVYNYIEEGNKDEIPSLICIDSLAGFTTDHEMRQGIKKATMGDVPKILNRFLRLTMIPLKRYGSTVIFNNQLREKLDSRWGGTTTPGGRGMKHWAKYMINMYDLSTSSNLFDHDGLEGHPVSFQVEKGKNLTIHKGFTFDMDVIFGKGFSRALDVINFGIQNEYIEQRGAYYTLPTGEKVHGMQNLLDTVKANDLTDAFYRDIMGIDDKDGLDNSEY